MSLKKASALVTQPSSKQLVLSGTWTAYTVHTVSQQFSRLDLTQIGEWKIDASQLDALDSSGAWVLHGQLQKLRDAGSQLQFLKCAPPFQAWINLLEHQIDLKVPVSPPHSFFERIGEASVAIWKEIFALFSFIGACSLVFMHGFIYPAQWRWRQLLYNIQKSGFDALALIGLTSFFMGIVVAYQGADQLKLYSANIFVVDLIGFSILREFSPLITAILIAGRSGSAYAAQIGTMVVTDEVEALRILGIDPINMLVLPKIMALVIALPLLTVFADVAGVGGGMIMARVQLGIGFPTFLSRFGHEIGLTAFLIGVGKSLVFAVVIALLGCFQGFRTQANADSVGRQTTRSVVQSIFAIITADAIFSIIFSLLGL